MYTDVKDFEELKKIEESLNLDTRWTDLSPTQRQKVLDEIHLTLAEDLVGEHQKKVAPAKEKKTRRKKADSE